MAAIETCPPLARQSVLAAARRIANNVHTTPVLSSKYMDQVASTPQTSKTLENSQWAGHEPAKPRLHFLFKCENFQRIGAFKARGAFNAVHRLNEERHKQSVHAAQQPNGVAVHDRPLRVISHSSGNHAQAVALAGKEMGFPAHIVMPAASAPAKIAATKFYGAEVHFSGPTPQERLRVVDKLMSDTSFDNVFIPPYDHPDTILGQGTIGLELQDQAQHLLPPGQRLNGIIAPCGGGGMLSGVALSCENTSIDVFGAEPSFEGADDCRRGLLQKRRIEVVRSTSIADGLRTPVGSIPWSVISDPSKVRGVFAVTEDQIRSATGLILERMKILVEPSSAVPLAVALYNEDFRHLVEDGQRSSSEPYNLGLVISGGNVDLSKLSNVLLGN
ncbi:Serine racemase [Exophiala dermatitidis]